MKTKPADIVLTQGKNLFSRVILWVLRFFQADHVNFNHVLMVCDDIIGIEATNGVTYVDIANKLENSRIYKIIRRVDLTDEQRIKIVNKAKKCLGQKYGFNRIFLQLLDQIFHTNWFTRRTKYKRHICSGLVAWAYYAAYKIKFNDVNWCSCEPDDIDDESLNNPDLWEIIYNG